MKKVGDAQMVVSQLTYYTVQNMAYWPVWITQHHGWMIRFPSAIIPACFNNLPWFFCIHALILVCGLYLYWGQLTRGYLNTSLKWSLYSYKFLCNLTRPECPKYPAILVFWTSIYFVYECP